MSRTVLQSPFLVGFDHVERAIERVAKAGDGYPPYNIERLEPEAGEAARLRITVAVAGFAPDELDVTSENDHLVVRGERERDDGGPNGERQFERQFLHRGIAARQFTRAFVLAEGWEAGEAHLARGLLTIDVVRPAVEEQVRRIAISVEE